jgi:hypothetical protein
MPNATKGVVRLLVVATIVGAVFIVVASRTPLLTRHTTSHGSSMMTFGASSSVWARITYIREIWVAPDGSGRINQLEQPPSFPSDAERAEWLELGSPTGTPISQAFGPGQLAYISLDDVPRDSAKLAKELAKDEATPSEILRRVVLLLFETVPPLEVTNAVVNALRQMPGVVVEDLGTRVKVTGADEAPQGGRLSTIVIDMRTGQLVSEKRIATESIPGLPVDPPILMLERIVDATELMNQ